MTLSVVVALIAFAATTGLWRLAKPVRGEVCIAADDDTGESIE